MCKVAISYHTFIFPFLWNDGGKVPRKKFAKCLNPGLVPDWIPEKVSATNKDVYASYRYFNRATLNAMFMEEHNSKLDDDAIVWNYKFDIPRLSGFSGLGGWLDAPKGAENPAKYIIKKGEKSYELCVNGIRVKLFNTGVGMIIFELENYLYSEEKEILEINEFGRRVFMPHLENDDRSCHLCADSISLCYEGETVAEGRISGAESKNEKDIVLAEPLNFILKNKISGFGITTSEKHSKNEFYIEPIIDDRMFVACFYLNEQFVSSMSDWKNGKYTYMLDAEEKRTCAPDNTARKLYEMIYVDGDGMSCHNRDMLQELLSTSVYARWLEYGFLRSDSGNFDKSGTITGITEYSMVCVSSYAGIYGAFVSLYVEMMILVLAQRASLLAFERIISEIACKKSKLNVKKVQESYILFQSELLLQEVTPQQQGIEMYNMMCEQLFINKQQSEIENQIRSLAEWNTSKSESAENSILFILACLGLFELAQTTTEWICRCVDGDWKQLPPVILVIVGAALWLIYRIKRRK